MSLEDFRAQYKSQSLTHKIIWAAQYRVWRDSRSIAHRTPMSFRDVIYGGPGPQKHYDNVLRAFLTDIATQRLLGESS